MSQAEDNTSSPSVEPPKMVAVKRRTRRRSGATPVKRKVLVVLVTTFVVLLFLILIPGASSTVRKFLHTLFRGVHISPELGALMIAGTVLLFLIPGVDEKILTILGLRKKSRSRNSHR
ncbi:hypothetical protein [Armatimonas sp.]|uniref:hypothetical protein n=1 Tax=Armatimonas sp. TaxID=1872638 RepID=UPI00286D5C51|nr:hypothetical protein [Armatimonas sp.]